MLIYPSSLHRGTSKSQSEDAAGSSQDDEQPGPSRRKRQPSMSETMPLYMLCKEDLDSMDKEVRKGGTIADTFNIVLFGPHKNK